MSTENGHVNIAGLKVDRTFTVGNFLQILVLLIGGCGIALAGYIDRRDTKAMVVELQEQLDVLNDSRVIVIEKNDRRMNEFYTMLNSHESRLNVFNVESARLSERLGELFDELRSLNAYLRETRYTSPSTTPGRGRP